MEDEARALAEIEVMKARMNEQDKRFDKIDNNIQKIWEKIDLHRESSIKTQTLVERLSKDFNDTRMDISKAQEKMSDKIDVLLTKMSQSEGRHSEKQANKVNFPFWVQALISTVAVGISLIAIFK